MTAALARRVALATLGTVLAGAGCTSDPGDKVAAAASKASGLRTLEMALSLERSTGSEAAGVRSSVASAFDMSRGVGRLKLQTNVPSLPPSSCEGVVSGKSLFLRVPETRRGDYAGKAWVKTDASGLSAAFPSDPQKILQLGSRARNLKQQGKEKVRGTATTRYDGKIAVSDLVAHLPRDLRSQTVRSYKESGVDVVPLSIWLDGPGLARRLRLEITSRRPGISSTDVTVVEFFNYGKPVRVDLPEKADVLDAHEGNAAGNLCVARRPS
ncbi:MAG TPA: hypothetical protein VNE62_01875 [Actinomycetota bacterium]|nr:hypothetical protein [Actinomycetota bacterium]